VSAELAVRPLASPPDAVVRVPGSKSITNRALLLAALADGESTLRGALSSDDTRYMAAALDELGVPVAVEDGGRTLRLAGGGGGWPVSRADLFVGNAGTAMRFLIAALCLGDGRYRIDGSARMRERPVGPLVAALNQLGADARCELDSGTPPVVIAARGLRGGRAALDASRSSQFLSALLHVAPYAAADVEIAVGADLIARPYVEMTLRVMRQFGVEVEHDDLRRFRVAAGQRYGGRDYAIEPDASAAHYFWAAAALSGGRVRVEGIGADSMQGDVAFVDVLERMGAEVVRGATHVEVHGRGALAGVDVDMNAISDTAPTLAVLGAFASSPVSIRNVQHLRWQESDRLHAVATELARLGVEVEERDDGLTVHPAPPRPTAPVQTYDDHRIAMSFALAGLVVDGIRIVDPGCVAKTFPDFFERLEELRGAAAVRP
jgi:3-phosphoshikimate 1-carboxyvinyltransferase